MSVQSNIVVIPIEQLTALINEAVQEKTNTLLDEFRVEKKLAELPEYMTRSEVATYYNVTSATVYNWEKEGLLTRAVIGNQNNNVIRYHRDEVLALKN